MRDNLSLFQTNHQVPLIISGTTLKEESNAEETFARRQIREIYGINFRESQLLSFFARINFRDLAAAGAVIQCF